MKEWIKKRTIKRSYDTTAHMYDMRYAEEQAAKIEAALASFEIKKRSKFLDAGCGTGILFSYVAGKAETIVGLDISKKILFKAKKRAETFPSVNLIQADIDNMPLKDNIFNCVFAVTLLQNTPNPILTLKELRRTAKDDAVIVVTGMKKAFAEEEFMKLLRDAGLKIIALKHEGLKCYVAICIKP